jgi:CRISPR type III-A-associated protein Csm2
MSREIPRQIQGQSREPRSVKTYFDPTKPDRELFDTLAEKQAIDLPKVNPSQLHRFFGEIKDLYRQFNASTVGADDEFKKKVYQETIEPRFKMVRSKVAYATRPGQQSKLPREFADVLRIGIGKVNKHEDFTRFVMHLEAVVGFMFGKLS